MVVCGAQEEISEDFILKSCFFFRFTTLRFILFGNIILSNNIS